MTKIAQRMSEKGFVLRSGGAKGADEAFENGAGEKEIYLPWRGFRDNPSPLFDLKTLREAMLIAEKYHPAWNKCTPGARKLHARNSFQVLGSTLDSPAEYDGGPTGGTGQAIRIATALKIPVLNLYLDWAIDEAFAII